MADENLVPRVPPHSEEAEQSVIGSILIDHDAVGVAAENLKAEDFYNLRHKEIFEAILDLYHDGRAVDLVTLKSQLEQRGKLDEMGERFAELKEIYLVPLWQKMADNNIDSAVEEELVQAEKLLQTFVQELQIALVEIAVESNLDLFVFYDEKGDGYHIYPENLLQPINEEGTSEYDASALYDKRIVIHHNGYRSEKDAFMVLTLFCFLVGVCVGGFFAVCRQSKAETAQRTEKGNED